MRLLVNLLPVTRGGGRQNALNLWSAIRRHGGADAWLVVARPELGLSTLGSDQDGGANGVPDPVPHGELREWSVGGFGHRLWLENRALVRLARAWDADVIFTPMGAGPVTAALPTVIGWHDSTVAYPEVGLGSGDGAAARTWDRLRAVYAGRAARAARCVCVQTRVMADRLGPVWGIPSERFRIVPNGPSELLAGQELAPEERPAPHRILVIGEPKPAKNLEIAPAVAAALLERSLPEWSMDVTVPEGGDGWSAPFDAAYRATARESLPLRRIGVVPHAALGPVYRQSSVVFLPSLLESFSATYVEAMHFGVPLVTSDRDFAREICGEAALYAEPTDPDACAGAIARLLLEPGLRARIRAAGFQRVVAFPDWRERLDLYRDACRSAVERAA